MTNEAVRYSTVILLTDDPFHDAFRSIRLQRHRYAGLCFQEAHQYGWKMAGSEPGQAGDPDVTASTFGEVAAQIVKMIEAVKNAPDFCEKITRIVRRLKDAASARKKLKTS